MNLIAFTGLATCGKSTAASHLVDTRGYVRMSFAQPIRDMLKAGLGLTDLDLGQNKEKPHPLLGGKTPRYAMQTLGTEWGRDGIQRNLWVDITGLRVEKAFEQGFNVVIDDCRFDNEAFTVKDLGGIVVEIARPGLVRKSHASEAGVTPNLIDRRISNDGTREALLRIVDTL